MSSKVYTMWREAHRSKGKWRRAGRLYPDKNSLTQARLKSLLHYDPATGFFTRLVAPNPRFPVGSIAGYRNGQGYTCICIDGHLYRASRLVWFYVHGRWPRPLVDHINGIRTDDRLSNLREATLSQNAANSDHKGLTINRAGRWQVQITHLGKVNYVGLFPTRAEARAAYEKAAREIFGEFVRAQ